MKFTFKRNVPTGQYRSFAHIQTDIKLNKKIVGSINEGDGFNNWSIQLVVKDESNSAGWRWAKLKKKCASEDEARKFVNDNFDALIAKNLGEI